MDKNKSRGTGIGDSAVALLMSIYGDEVRALPNDAARTVVLDAMRAAVGPAVDAARAQVDVTDRSRINALVTMAADQLAATLIARAGVRQLRALQAVSAAAIAEAAIGRAAA